MPKSSTDPQPRLITTFTWPKIAKDWRSVISKLKYCTLQATRWNPPAFCSTTKTANSTHSIQVTLSSSAMLADLILQSSKASSPRKIWLVFSLIPSETRFWLSPTTWLSIQDTVLDPPVARQLARDISAVSEIKSKRTRLLILTSQEMNLFNSLPKIYQNHLSTSSTTPRWIRLATSTNRIFHKTQSKVLSRKNLVRLLKTLDQTALFWTAAMMLHRDFSLMPLAWVSAEPFHNGLEHSCHQLKSCSSLLIQAE